MYLIKLLLFLPIISFANMPILPSLYGNEFGINIAGHVDLKKPEVVAETVQFDILNTQTLDKFYLTTQGRLKQGDPQISASAFVKVNEYVYIGGGTLTEGSFKFSSEATALFFAKWKKLDIHPYLSIDVNTKKFKNAGLKIYYDKIVAFNVSYMHVPAKSKDIDFYWAFGVSTPLETKILEDLLAKFKGGKK